MQRILSVDGDRSTLDLLADALGEKGYDVRLAADAPGALRSCETDPPDLILLGETTLDADGLTLCAQLRGDRALDAVPIVLLATRSDPPDVAAGFAAGADDCMSKPFALVELYARVSAALRMRDLMLELAHKRAEAMGLAEELIRTTDDLRARLAADLHDSVVQTLVGTRLLLEDVSRDLGVPTALATRAQSAASSVAEAIEDARRLMNGLAPLTLDADSALQLTLDRACRLAADAEVAINATVPDGIPSLSQEAAQTFYRLVDEAVTNAVRHAGASRIDIEVSAAEDGTTVIVTDDGVGFDTETVGGIGFGIAGMRARAEMIGGRLDLHSVRGQGTRVRAWLPTEGWQR